MTNLKLPEDFETYPEARKNAFLKMKELKESGRRIVGVFCTYTPWELIEAADAAAVVLCGIGDDNIPIAETRLPQNLCPLIKASYGAALADRCPFFYFSDMVLAETTCDGKKKMYFYVSKHYILGSTCFCYRSGSVYFDNGNDSRTWCKFILYYRICRNDNRIFWRKLLSLQKRMSCYLIH